MRVAGGGAGDAPVAWHQSSATSGAPAAAALRCGRAAHNLRFTGVLMLATTVRPFGPSVPPVNF